MPHQNEITQLIVLYHIQNVLNRCLRSYIFAGEMHPLSHAGEGDGIGGMTAHLKVRDDFQAQAPSQASGIRMNVDIGCSTRRQ
jgi:hypothetical protein